MPLGADIREQPAFAFTDEDCARRYQPPRPHEVPQPAAASAPAEYPAARPACPHGGGNSFMRARRRRRLAAAP